MSLYWQQYVRERQERFERLWDGEPVLRCGAANSRELTPEQRAKQTRMLESVYPGLFRQEGSDVEVA